MGEGLKKPLLTRMQQTRPYWEAEIQGGRNKKRTTEMLRDWEAEVFSCCHWMQQEQILPGEGCS